MENLSDALDSKDKLKLDRLDDVIESCDENEQSLLILSSDTLSLNSKLEEYLNTNINNIIKIDTIKDGLFKKILSNVKEYKNKYILINLFSIKDYIPILEEFQFKRDYIPQERLKFIFLLNFPQYESFKTKAYDFFSFNNFFHHFIDNSYTFVNDIDLSELDDMIKEYEEIKDTNISNESRMKYLYDIANKAFSFSLPKISLKYFDEALVFADKLKDKYMRALIMHLNGENYLNLGNLNRALIYQKEALRIFKKIKSEFGIMISHNLMGIIYSNLGKNDLAMSNYKKSLDLAIKTKDKSYEATSLGNIGLNYTNNGNFEKALIHHEKALIISTDIDYKLGIADTLGNIGIIYQKNNNFDLALEYQNKALIIDKEIKNSRGISIDLGNIGNIYKDKNDFNLALKYQNESLKIFKDIGYRQGEAESLYDISNTYKKLQNFELVEKYREESLSIAQSLGFHAIISKIEKDKINNKEER